MLTEFGRKKIEAWALAVEPPDDFKAMMRVPRDGREWRLMLHEDTGNQCAHAVWLHREKLSAPATRNGSFLGAAVESEYTPFVKAV